MRRLIYWCCESRENAAYNIRTRTRREAIIERGDAPEAAYGAPYKVTVEYDSALDLIQRALGPDRLYEERAYGRDNGQIRP